MRKLYFIGVAYCARCNRMLRDAVEPLYADYPDQIEEVVTSRWNEDLARIDGRKKITNVPTVVIEDDGEEVFRYSGVLDEAALRAQMEV